MARLRANQCPYASTPVMDTPSFHKEAFDLTGRSPVRRLKML